MFRRHTAGEPGMPQRVNKDGTPQTREEVMAGIHKWTEAWAEEHRGKSLNQLVAAGLAVRSDTLMLLSELTDEQLESKIPGTPWADSTVGGIMAANADHGRMHFNWAKAGTATA
ncbi:MAG: DinB family protein, partial [Tepidiformaceae bacterium]